MAPQWCSRGLLCTACVIIGCAVLFKLEQSEKNSITNDAPYKRVCEICFTTLLSILGLLVCGSGVQGFESFRRCCSSPCPKRTSLSSRRGQPSDSIVENARQEISQSSRSSATSSSSGGRASPGSVRSRFGVPRATPGRVATVDKSHLTKELFAALKDGQLERAEKCLHQMVASGWQPDIKSYSAVIGAYAKSNDTESAMRLLEGMRAAGITPDQVPYNAVLDAVAKNRDLERLSEVFSSMKMAGVEPNTFSFTCMARPHAYAGRVAEVERLAQEMEASGLMQDTFFLYTRLLAHSHARPCQPLRAEAAFRHAVEVGVPINDRVVSALGHSIGRARAQDLACEFGQFR